MSVPSAGGGTDTAMPVTRPAPPLRIAFVNTHPIQYFAPLYAYLTRTGRFDVTALYLSDFSIRGGLDKGFGRAVTWDVDLLAGYTPTFMGKAASNRRTGGFFSMVAPELWSAIRDGNFDAVVINGHNLAAHHVALAAARSSSTPVFTRGETHPRLRRSGWRAALRTGPLKAWYRLFDGCLAFDAGDVAGLAAALRPLPVDADHRARAGEASRERISRWGHVECSVALEAAVTTARRRRGLGRT